MNKFQKYLIEKAHISKKYIPYYLKWVDSFLNQLSREDKSKFTSQQKENYLLMLSAEQEDWQVKQADHALRLYRHFLSIENNRKRESTKDATEAWRFAAEEMRRILRLRHRSYRTEKTYI